MKKALTLVFFIAVAAVAQEHHSARLQSNAAFERMKLLAGDWKADIPNAGVVNATYSIQSDGSALLEELQPQGEPSMITVYYPSGNSILMTHYCSGHTQPHMKASGADVQTVKFTTTSVDNLASKNDDRMSAVQFNFRDNDHFTETWDSINAGKATSMPFEFTRVR